MFGRGQKLSAKKGWSTFVYGGVNFKSCEKKFQLTRGGTRRCSTEQVGGRPLQNILEVFGVFFSHDEELFEETRNEEREKNPIPRQQLRRNYISAHN